MNKVSIPLLPCEVTSIHFSIGGCPPVEVRIPPIIVKQDDDVLVVQASTKTYGVLFDVALDADTWSPHDEH